VVRPRADDHFAVLPVEWPEAHVQFAGGLVLGRRHPQHRAVVVNQAAGFGVLVNVTVRTGQKFNFKFISFFGIWIFLFFLPVV